MTTTGLRNFDTTIRKTNEWLADVCRELGGGDRHEAYRVLRATLQTLRDQLSSEENAKLSAQLPMLVRGIYFEGWRPGRTEPRIRCEDEFLTLVTEHYGAGPLDARLAACAVFRVLAERVSKGEVEDVRHILPKALRNLWPRAGSSAIYLGDDPYEDVMGKPVSEFMTRGVIWAAPQRPLDRVLQRMNEERIRHVLVVNPSAIDGDGTIRERAILGIVSPRDVLRELEKRPHEGIKLSNLTVGEVMTPQPLHTISPATPLADAGGVMRETRISALPVMAQGVLVGLLTSNDLLEAGSLATRQPRSPETWTAEVVGPGTIPFAIARG